ncbi:MAG: DUF4236 domain-containing protein, partial [Alphaproteobacteria bacterium]
MGFYIRKSISAGPFRFNLSGSGVGLSVGVKGFRIGSGPRGNYVHMGRGGLYYRASLNRPSRPATHDPTPGGSPLPSLASSGLAQIETGDILQMMPVQSADIVQEISDKVKRLRLWPWVLSGGIMFSGLVFAQPEAEAIGLAALVLTLCISLLFYFGDLRRKTVVIMYDLDDGIVKLLELFSQQFDEIASAKKIWNIDAAGRTTDWKRNAGASHLITRKPARFGYGVPSVIKTNIDPPCIIGGRQNVYFFPDIVLITEGNHVGAISYRQLKVIWDKTAFLEDEGVPADTTVIGHTWRYVNRNGQPDRRFNNNRQIPRVLYQEMGLTGTGGFQKLLHISQ